MEIAADEYLHSPRFSARERAAVLWAEHVARNTARERDDVFAEVKKHFSDSEFMELTSVCGQFAISNRFQDTMRLPLEEQGDIDKIKLSVRADPVRIRSYLVKLLTDWPREFPVVREAVAERAAASVTVVAAAAQTQGGSGRLPLLNTNSATGEGARYLAAAQSLLGGVTNAIRTWAHDPYQAKLFLPLQLVLERAGIGSILSSRLKLLVSIRIGHLNRADYSLAHRHAMAASENIEAGVLAALAAADWKSSGLFSASENAALTWAEHVTDNSAKRRGDLFEVLGNHFAVAEIVELTGLCAFANRMDLLHNALRIPCESANEIAALNRSPRLEPGQLKDYLETLLVNWPTAFPVPSATD